LVPYVYFRFQFGPFRQFLHTWIDTWTPGHVDTSAIETVEQWNLTEGTN
jgi:hypothetical protein